MFYIAKVTYYNDYAEENCTEHLMISEGGIADAINKITDLYCGRDDGSIDETILEALTLIPVGDEGYLALNEEQFNKLAKEWAGI